MPIISANATLIEYTIRSLRSAESDADDTRLCLWGLGEMLDQRAMYDTALIGDSPFAAQFPDVLRCAVTSGYYFSLLETLIIFSRERVLRRPDIPETPMESALFSYFAHSGEWHFSDGTLITDWYHVRLPVMVLSDLQIARNAAATEVASSLPGS